MSLMVTLMVWFLTDRIPDKAGREPPSRSTAKTRRAERPVAAFSRRGGSLIPWPLDDAGGRAAARSVVPSAGIANPPNPCRPARLSARPARELGVRLMDVNSPGTARRQVLILSLSGQRGSAAPSRPAHGCPRLPLSESGSVTSGPRWRFDSCPVHLKARIPDNTGCRARHKNGHIVGPRRSLSYEPSELASSAGPDYDAIISFGLPLSLKTANMGNPG